MSKDTSYVAIEYPSAGLTYSHDEYGVYKYGTYATGVLRGRESRTFLDSFATLEAAQEQYPTADITSCQFVETNLDFLPGDDDLDPTGEYLSHI